MTENRLKVVELKLIAELMKNSRRSDRELAQVIGTSQPTVTRLRKKLEKDGIVKEYTMIPDFSKLGLELLSITFAKRPHDVSSEEMVQIEREGMDVARKQGVRTIMALRGLGLGYDVAIVALHPNYSAFTEVVQTVRTFPHTDVSDIDSFVINLKDRVQYRAFTFSYVAAYLSEMADKAEKEHEWSFQTKSLE